MEGGDGRGTTPEERRLRDFLGRSGQGAGDDPAHGWPARLVAEHPELFKPRRGEAERPGGRGGLGRLLLVTLPLLVLLVVAEINDSLIGHAGLLALLLGIGALSFWVGYLAPPWIAEPRERARNPLVGAFERHYVVTGRIGAVVMAGLFAMTAYFGLREGGSVDELALLVTPVPEITDVVYVPTAGELSAVAGIVGLLDAAAGGAASRDLRRAARDTPSDRRMWLLKTRLDTAAVRAFYQEAGNRSGWALDAAENGFLLMVRGDEQLLLFVTDDWPRPDTRVLYMHGGR